MKRRLFIVMLLASCAAAQAQQPPQEVPPDRVTVEEFKSLRAGGKVLALDVRHHVDRKIKGAAHVPLDQMEARLAELPRDREIVTYCA